MPNSNAALANNTALPESHRHYQFGDFQERLAHVCDLLEIETPEFPVDDEGDVLMSEEVSSLLSEHQVCANWLFIGNPSSILEVAINNRKSAREFCKHLDQLEPEVAVGFEALLRSVVMHGIEIGSALEVFDGIVKEHRSTKLVI